MILQVSYITTKAQKILQEVRASTQYSFNGVYIISYSFCQPFYEAVRCMQELHRKMGSQAFIQTSLHENIQSAVTECHSQNTLLKDIRNNFLHLFPGKKSNEQERRKHNFLLTLALQFSLALEVAPLVLQSFWYHLTQIHKIPVNDIEYSLNNYRGKWAVLRIEAYEMTSDSLMIIKNANLDISIYLYYCSATHCLCKFCIFRLSRRKERGFTINVAQQLVFFVFFVFVG